MASYQSQYGQLSQKKKNFTRLMPASYYQSTSEPNGMNYVNFNNSVRAIGGLRRGVLTRPGYSNVPRFIPGTSVFGRPLSQVNTTDKRTPFFYDSSHRQDLLNSSTSDMTMRDHSSYYETRKRPRSHLYPNPF